MLMRLLKSNLWVLVLSNCTNAFNYGLQLVLARYLSSEDYGIFNAVTSLGLIAGAVFHVLPYVATKELVRRQNDPGAQYAAILSLLRFSCWLSLAFALVTGLLAEPIASYLHLESIEAIFTFLAWMISMQLLVFLTGVMNGLLRYVRATSHQATSAVLRLLLTLAAVIALGYSYNAVFLVGTVGNLIVVWLMWRDIRALLLTAPGFAQAPRPPVKPMLGLAGPLALNWLAINLITNVDLVIVKHFAAPDEAGHYSGAAIIARIATFLPLMLISVLFPEVAARAGKKESSFGVTALVLALTGGTCLAFTAIIYLDPGAMMQLIFGDKFAHSYGYLPLLTLAMSCVAGTTVLTNAALARSDFRFLYPLYAIAAIGLGAIYWRYHGSIEEIVWGIFTIAATIFTALLSLDALRYFAERLQAKSN